MGFLAAGGVALLVLYGLARLYTSIDPAALVKGARYILGGALLIAATVLAFSGRWGVGLLLAVGGISALRSGRIGPLDFGTRRRHAGMASRVRSAWLEMQLDHDSGAMEGTVRQGEFAGRSLDDLDVAALQRLYAEVAGDAESRALVEAYLDRRIPGWREDVEGDRATGAGGAADAGAMTDQQAYEILGLSPGATDVEIRAAHRRLMKRVHPDQGGSTFLAAKINQAKDWLLSKQHR